MAFLSTSELVADTPNSTACVTRREAIHGGSAMISISSKVTSAIEFGLANLGETIIACRNNHKISDNPHECT